MDGRDKGGGRFELGCTWWSGVKRTHLRATPRSRQKEEQTTLLDQNAQFILEPTMASGILCVAGGGEEGGRRGLHVQTGLGSGRSEAFMFLQQPASSL